MGGWFGEILSGLPCPPEDGSRLVLAAEAGNRTRDYCLVFVSCDGQTKMSSVTGFKHTNGPKIYKKKWLGVTMVIGNAMHH